MQFKTKAIYKKLLENKTITPTGLLNWATEFDINEGQLKLACSFASLCTKDIFRHVFQFKINTQILPTKNYLLRYKVVENDQCTLCGEHDTILHRIWSCREVLAFIESFFTFLNLECGTSLTLDSSRNEYLFGFEGNISEALNHIFLEMKIFNFYTLPKDVGLGQDTLKNVFLNTLRKLIVKEKFVSLLKNDLDSFEFKWEYFTAIYDWRGPDFDPI